MTHLLNLLAAIALLVWGTHIVRTGMLRVFGENLRAVLAKSFGSRPAALLAGLGVTSLVQSATATCLIVASFVGKGMVPTAAALAVMLGADVGTAMMAVVFSFDLSWLSPLLIFVGVVMFVARQASGAGRIGRVLIGLGLTVLFGNRLLTGYRRGALVGVVHGAIWWVLGPLMIMPAMMGMPLVALNPTAVLSLMGHMVFGAILGLVAVRVIAGRP